MTRRLLRLVPALFLSGLLLATPFAPTAHATQPPSLWSAATAGQPPWSDLPGEVLGAYGISYEQVAAISQGYAGGLWEPYQDVTRAQFTTMAVMAFGIAPADPDIPSFADVPKSSAHYHAIEGATAAGVVDSVAPQVFKPDDPITREQAISVASRCLALANSIDLATWHTADEINRILAIFGDAASISVDLRDEFAFAVEHGITSGNQHGNVTPRSRLTRIQAAAFLIRAQPRTIDAKAYCYGDGVTNDTAAIAAALAACKAGDTLYFPAGTYLGDLVGKEGVFITGAGDGRGASTSWIKGKVTTAPHMNFTDIKMGAEGPAGYSFGKKATHGMTATRCTFTGGPADGLSCAVIAYDSVDCYDVKFLDCLIEGDYSNTSRGGFHFASSGQASARIYNIEFRNCYFESAQRGGEVLSRINSAKNPYDYPVQNVSFYGCTFEGMGASTMSYGFLSVDEHLNVEGGAALGQDGYSYFCDNVLLDSGIRGPNYHGLEAAGAVHMTITGNTIKGSHVRTMLSMTNTSDTKWHATNNGTSGLLRSYNVVTGNVFDGSASAESGLSLRTSNWTFSGNTVIHRADCYVKNATEGRFENNTVIALDHETGVGYSTNYSALWALDTDQISWVGNTFKSKNWNTVCCGAPACPSTNNTFTSNTYVKDSGDTALYVLAGSNAAETGAQHLLAE